MKKILILIVFIGATQLMQGQAKYGIKGGINYNSNSFSNVKDDVLSGGKSKTGFHAGVWLRAKIPALGIYVQPELVYTQLNNELNYTLIPTKSISTNYETRKIDLPLLLGKKIFSVARVFAGPSLQYIIDGDFSTDDIKKVEADGFSMGMQVGAGVDLGKLGIDVRWERAFSDTESKLFANDGASVSDTEFKFDTRVSQIIVSVSYQF